MITIFGLFMRYDDARSAVDELLRRGFDEGKMNAVAQDNVIKGHIDVPWNEIKVDVTPRLGEKSVYGLDEMFGRKERILIAEVGNVFAAGDLAGIMAKAAARPEVSREGMEGALIDFGMPVQAAQACVADLKQGGILFWVRVIDEKAPEAARLLREHKAARVLSIA